jgi:DNA polymerase-3 subunit alpha
MFVHLHNHSEYSILDGAIKIYEMAARAAKLNMPAIALTDHGVMYGAVDFYKACRKSKVKPIIGCEAYVVPKGIKNQNSSEENFHLILLAENNTGYNNLLSIVSEAHTKGFYYKPRVDLDILQKYNEGIICATACIGGEVPQYLLRGDMHGARDAIGRYNEIFKGRLYVELQDHKMKEEAMVLPHLVQLANDFKLPVIATQDAHYLAHEDYEAHDILLCVQTLSKQEDPVRFKFPNDEFYLKTPQQMQELFHWLPEACSNTLEIAERCNVELELGKPHPPKFTDIQSDDPKEHMAMLVDLVNKGLAHRYGCAISQEIRDRMDYELRIIEQTGFIDYFLVIWDFIKYAKDNGISVGPGRGSGAASLISYCLNITDVDPLEYGLFFERFLNPERISPPDLDIDFDDTRRGEVIRYVTQKYGEDSVAQVATFGRMEARAVLRDVGRSLGFSYGDMDKIAKLVPFGSDLAEALEQIPQLRELASSDIKHQKLFEYAKKLEGLVRNVGVHAAGVVIADKPLQSYVPLQLDKEGKRVVQFEKNAIEELGLLKMDFLGLRNLSVIERTVKTVKERHDIDLDMTKIPLDDPDVYKLLQEGDTTGVFQLESSGMRRYLKELKPTIISDIIAMVALYRPGPMEYIPKFIAGKNGTQDVTYLDASLENSLKDTYGVAVYQEQVLQIARDFAGFSLGQADILRKAVGKKIADLLAEQKKLFIEKAVANGKNAKLAEEVFKFIEPFAGYGFNRAHATCYGFISYRTAYLKAHYRLEYYMSILTSYIGNEDRIKEMHEECRRTGLQILPPDINASASDFSIEDNAIRYALSALKNVGEAAVSLIIAERNKKKFSSFEDFQDRVDSTKVNKKVIESLIKAGAFDSLDPDRGDLLERQSSENGGLSLFGAVEEKKPSKYSKEQLLSMEKEILGFYMSDHPMRPFERMLAMEDHTAIADLVDIEEDSTVKVIGIITSVAKTKSKRGAPIANITLEDLTGIIKITAFGEAFDSLNAHLESDDIMVISGRLEKGDGSPRIIASKFEKTITRDDLTINEEDSKFNLNILIHLETQSHLLSSIKNICASNKGDNPLILHLEKNGQRVKLTTEKDSWVSSNQETVRQIRELVGANRVWLTR